MKTIIEYYYDAQDFSGLNATITLLSKKHGQLKNVIQDMVENVITWLDDVKTKHGTEKWLELLETLRGVTEGKVRTYSSDFSALLILLRSSLKPPERE